MQFQGFGWLSGHDIIIYEPLSHAQEIVTIKSSTGRSCKMKSALN